MDDENMPKKSDNPKKSGRVDYQPIAVPKIIVDMIDRIIKDGRFVYVSRNDFVRDAIRRRIEEISKLYETEVYKIMGEPPDLKPPSKKKEDK